MEAMTDIALDFGDELVGGPAATIPRVAASETYWFPPSRRSVAWGERESDQSDSEAMSAMMAILSIHQTKHQIVSKVVCELNKTKAALKKAKKKLRLRTTQCENLAEENANFRAEHEEILETSHYRLHMWGELSSAYAETHQELAHMMGARDAA